MLTSLLRYPSCLIHKVRLCIALVSAAFLIFCVLEGMDLNPLFTMSTSFRPAGAGGELKLFEQVGISLVHGWLVDPEGPEGKTLEKVQDYDSAVSLIAEVDHLTHGRFVIDEDSPDPLTPTSPTTNWTESEKTMIEDGQ
jgi:hypothetical protein